MNTAHCAHRGSKRAWVTGVTLFAVLALAFPVTTVARAEAASPFIGSWRATDPADGSEIRLTIAGHPGGLLQVTWTEDYFSLCDGGAGLVRGSGWLEEGDAYLLQADLRAECKVSGTSIEFHWSWRYHAATDELSSDDQNGGTTIWSRQGHSQAVPPNPAFVAYIPGAVEGYQWRMGSSITVSIENCAYLAEARSEPQQDSPAGETRVLFELGDDCSIEAGDHIVMTDGIVTKDTVVTNLEVTAIDLAAGTVSGIYNPDLSLWVWLYGEDGFVPDTDAATGTWTADFGEGGLVPGAWGGATQWEEDGDGTSLDFQVPHARFFASEFGEWLWTTEFAPQSELTVSIFGSGPPGTTLLWEGPATTDDEGFVMVDSSQHKLDLLPGYYIRVSDGSITKGLVLLPLRVLVFDTANNRMAGTAPAGSEVWVAAGLQESQDGITVIADTQGSWEADLTGIVDITEDMRAWSYAQIFDADGDVNEADPPWPEP